MAQINSASFIKILRHIFEDREGKFDKAIRIVTASLLKQFVKANAMRMSFDDAIQLLNLVLELSCNENSTIDEKEVLCESIKLSIIRSSYRVMEDNTRSALSKEVFFRLTGNN